MHCNRHFEKTFTKQILCKQVSRFLTGHAGSRLKTGFSRGKEELCRWILVDFPFFVGNVMAVLRMMSDIARIIGVFQEVFSPPLSSYFLHFDIMIFWYFGSKVSLYKYIFIFLQQYIQVSKYLYVKKYLYFCIIEFRYKYILVFSNQ